MTRDEWVVLPVLSEGRVGHLRWPKADIGPYHEVQGKVQFIRRDSPVDIIVDLPLAEFEALLFGPTEPDAYTRAAVAYAEAHFRMREASRTGQAICPAVDAYDDALDAFLRLYRERHDAQR